MFRHCLIVSENSGARERLAAELRGHDVSVTLVDSPEDALRAAAEIAVDTVVVAGAPAGMRVATLRRRLEQERPGCRVVAVQSVGELKRTSELLRLADDEFVLKASDLAGLVPGTADRESPEGASSRGRATTTALLGVADVLVGLLELRETWFGGSSHQAMRLARAVAERLAVDPDSPDEIALAALLRDIGRTDVPDRVLEARGDLDEDQRRLVVTHVESGIRLLESVEFPWKVIPIIRHHHERYDGAGYPDGLKGREIPLGARILAVTDAFLAMVSDRPYRKAMAVGDALAELVQSAGTQFDPEIVELFLAVAESMYPHREGHGRFRVLVVDSDMEFGNLLRLRLLNEDHEVLLVSTPDQALDELLQEPVDVLAVDVSPGDSSPFGLMEELRREESLRTIPFVCLAGTQDRALRIRALRLGVDDFISKSLDVEEITARIQNVLLRESARRGEGPRRRKGIEGRLENLSVPEIVQMLHIGNKTALVSLSASRKRARIWFEHGAIRHAKAGRTEGEDAVYELLEWKEGTFQIEHGVRTRKTTIDADPVWLLMEGLRRLDESTAAAR
jgi:response regulator RpfG family c-di-GMP phosphodiesterase